MGADQGVGHPQPAATLHHTASTGAATAASLPSSWVRVGRLRLRALLDVLGMGVGGGRELLWDWRRILRERVDVLGPDDVD